jgi:hypothetical protein
MGGPLRKMFRYFMGPNATDDPNKKFKIGVCAMDKKVRGALRGSRAFTCRTSPAAPQATSKQMNNITSRLLAYGEFEVFTFGDDVILNKPVEEWPLCDYLLSWFSDGFPLAKAQAYIALRKVPTMNDLTMQVRMMGHATISCQSSHHGFTPTATIAPCSSCRNSCRTGDTCTRLWWHTISPQRLISSSIVR